MDLTQIRYFLSLARTLNFTRAAEACHVTQPALTKSIQRLEEEIGGPLLLRERALTQLTALGQSMLPLLEQIYLAAERAKEHAAGLKRQIASPLRIGFTAEAPMAPFMPVFAELAAKLAGFELCLVDGSDAGLSDALLHGGLDAAILTGAASLPDRLNRWTLFTDAKVLVMPPDHPLATAETVSIAALDGATVICRAPDGAMAKLLALALQEHGVCPATRHQGGTTSQVLDLVRAGFGITLSSALVALPGGLLKRKLSEHLTHDVVLAAVAGRPFTRATDAFIKLARAREWANAAGETEACPL